jgi:hypothetical protein
VMGKSDALSNLMHLPSPTPSKCRYEARPDAVEPGAPGHFTKAMTLFGGEAPCSHRLRSLYLKRYLNYLLAHRTQNGVKPLCFQKGS